MEVTQKTSRSVTNQPVTVHSLAEMLGVSATTVSRALNGTGRMSDATRRKILERAKAENYKPSLVARNLVNQRTKTLGVVVPMIGNTVYSPIVRGIEQVAFTKGYNIILCDTDLSKAKEQAYLDTLVQRRVEGIAITAVSDHNAPDCEHLVKLNASGIPVVMIDYDNPEQRLCRVGTDNFASASMLTEHLISLGHCRIAFIHSGLEPWDCGINARFNGYRDAIQRAGLEIDESLCVQSGEKTIDEAKSFDVRVVQELLLREDRPTAIFGFTDMMAIKVISVAHQMGLKVPEDLAVVGFDDILMSAYASVPLTTVRQPVQKVGKRAAEILFDRIESGGEEQQEPIHECFDGELVIRKSCGASSPDGKSTF